MSKDPFQILADELTLIRKDMDQLQRTSLDKDEAKTLHEIVAEAVEDMHQTISAAPETIQSVLAADRNQMARNATQAATEAAERVLGVIREQLTQERQSLSQAAGEARREAWRWFGGFWVWLASMGATGVALGLLIAYGTETAKTFFSVREMASYACEWRTWGGQMIDQDDGSSLCALWIKLPPQSGN
ncbi:MAG: hypothetical protein Q4P24_15845 [Rhodobacterales bacterium]|nr:hypothetical protein [Rhodobacterales bacterium]